MQELIKLEVDAAKEEIRCCDQLNAFYGLSLSERDITELIELRSKALKQTGRVEFGGGVLAKLIRAFCKSGYVDQENYVSVLAELQDAFYYFKNESQDRFSDDDLIEFMQKVFDGPAAGSTELMSTISLDQLCRWARNDFQDADYDEEDFF